MKSNVMATQSLWPAFEVVERTPIAILRGQAALLGRDTGQLVLAEVQVSAAPIANPVS